MMVDRNFHADERHVDDSTSNFKVNGQPESRLPPSLHDDGHRDPVSCEDRGDSPPHYPDSDNVQPVPGLFEVVLIRRKK